MLVDRWESFVLEEMVSFGVKEFLRAPATLLGSGHIDETEGQQAPGRHRADAACSSAWCKPPHPVAPHHAQHPAGLLRVAVGDGDRHRLGQDRRVRAAREARRARVEQGSVRARAVGRPWAPSTRWRRRRCPSCSRPCAWASASSATEACARTRRCRRRCAWAPTRCWSSACATSRPSKPSRRRGVDALPGRGVPRRQDPQRLPARPHRLRPGLPAPLQRAHRGGATPTRQLDHKRFDEVVTKMRGAPYRSRRASS